MLCLDRTRVMTHRLHLRDEFCGYTYSHDLKKDGIQPDSHSAYCIVLGRYSRCLADKYYIQYIQATFTISLCSYSASIREGVHVTHLNATSVTRTSSVINRL